MRFIKNYIPPYQRSMNIALTSILTALVCVATIVLYIPIPNTLGGYFNVGEVVIYISAILFGPFIGGIAGGVGAALADIFVAIEYAPATFVIKFCEGFIIGFIIYTAYIKQWVNWKKRIAVISALIIGGTIMVMGYFIYEAYIWPIVIGPGAGLAIAIISLPWNSLQAILSAIVAVPASIGIPKGLELEYEELKKID